MKIILAARSCYPFHMYGGMELYFYNLAKYLVKNGCEVEILTSGRLSGMHRYFHGIKYTFIPPRVVDQTLLFTHPLFARGVLKYLLSRRFDIVHACGAVDLYILLKRRRPVIIQRFGMEPIRHNWRLRGFHKLLIVYPTWKIMNMYADAIFAETEYLKNLIIRLGQVEPEKIFVLPVGVDLTRIDEALSNLTLSKRTLGLEDADLVLINVNRLEHHKGVDYLIKALRILNRTLDVRLVLVGTGSAEHTIKALIDNLNLRDKVLHFKNIPYELLYQLMFLADISVTPTLGEGTPTVILEAMACGKPIVASRVPGIVEVVKHGVNGLLVPPADSEAIAKAVLEIYDKGLITTMSARSREMVKAYDWDIIAKRALKIYEKLL